MDRISSVPRARAPCAHSIATLEATAAAPARCQMIDLSHVAMLRYQRGDQRAFAQLHRMIAPRLLRLCIALSGPIEAEDLAQEVFLKIHRARASYCPRG